MSIDKQVQSRAEGKCELCGNDENLSTYPIPPEPDGTSNQAIYTCGTCKDQLENPEKTDPNHWRCLNDSMWSTVPAVQVVAWRMLSRLKTEGWPQDLLDIMYLDEEMMEWAAATGEGKEEDPNAIIHRDSNGVKLENGDSVVLIKDLNVKGANFTAKRGTAVRNIILTHDNAEHIEGKVNGQHIVILTQYVKK